MTANDDRPNSAQLALAATLLTVSGLVTLWGYAFIAFPRLPSRIPAHFNGRGDPDRWVATTAASWFALPGFATGVVGLTIAAVWFCRWAAIHRPQLVNIPFKDRFLAASPSRRSWIVEPIVVALAFEGFVLASLFFLLLHGTEQVASGTWASLPAAGFAFFLPLLILTPIAGVGWTCVRAAKP